MHSLQVLGYPDYFSILLGVCQLIGVLLLVFPQFEKYREWAYLGFFLNLGFAMASHMIVEGWTPAIWVIIILMGLTLLSYFRFKNFKKEIENTSTELSQ